LPVPKVRLQPSERQIASRANWRQASNAELWHGNVRIRSLEGGEHCGLRSTRNGAVLQRNSLSIDQLFTWRKKIMKYKTAIFRKINKQKVAAHHDVLEFPDGQIVLLTSLCEGQQATCFSYLLSQRLLAKLRARSVQRTWPDTFRAALVTKTSACATKERDR